MPLTDSVAGVPEDVWAVFSPVLPPSLGRAPAASPGATAHACTPCSTFWRPASAGEFLPTSFPSAKTVQRRLTRWLALDRFHTARAQLAERYVRWRGINWGRVLLDGSKKLSKKGPRHGAVSRGSPYVWYGHPRSERRLRHALGAVVSAANVNDSVKAREVLGPLVVKPPPAEVPVAQPDRRELPHARADGAYANRPISERAAAAPPQRRTGAESHARPQAPERRTPRAAGAPTTPGTERPAPRDRTHAPRRRAPTRPPLGCRPATEPSATPGFTHDPRHHPTRRRGRPPPGTGAARGSAPDAMNPRRSP